MEYTCVFCNREVSDAEQDSEQTIQCGCGAEIKIRGHNSDTVVGLPFREYTVSLGGTETLSADMVGDDQTVGEVVQGLVAEGKIAVEVEKHDHDAVTTEQFQNGVKKLFSDECELFLSTSAWPSARIADLLNGTGVDVESVYVEQGMYRSGDPETSPAGVYAE